MVSGWKGSPSVSDALGSFVSSVASPASQDGSNPPMSEKKPVRCGVAGDASGVDRLVPADMGVWVAEVPAESAGLGGVIKVGLTVPLVQL